MIKRCTEKRISQHITAQWALPILNVCWYLNTCTSLFNAGPHLFPVLIWDIWLRSSARMMTKNSISTSEKWMKQNYYHWGVQCSPSCSCLGTSSATTKLCERQTTIIRYLVVITSARLVLLQQNRMFLINWRIDKCKLITVPVLLLYVFLHCIQQHIFTQLCEEIFVCVFVFSLERRSVDGNIDQPICSLSVSKLWDGLTETGAVCHMLAQWLN